MLAALFSLFQFVLQQPDPGFEFFNGGQLLLNLLYLDIIVGGDSHRCLDAFEGILNFCFVLVAADQKANGRILGGRLNQVINGVYIEIEFACEFRLKRNRLEFDHDVAVERNVEKEHVQFPGFAGNNDLTLPTEIGETGSEFQQESG